jgi:DNA polymerase III epsilon subunit-like protein
MKNIKNFQNFLNESIKHLNQKEVIEWLFQRSDYTFIALDTETTGLRGPREEQLTQIASVAFSFDFDQLKFTEIDSFNEKIKLNPEIISQLDLPDSRIRDVFKFTGYEINQEKYRDEQLVLDSLHSFIGKFDKVILLIQNASFDMGMINRRKRSGGLKYEIFDTKDFYAYFLLPTLQRLSEKDPEAKKILDVIGTTRGGNLPTSSLPKVASGLGIDNSGAHDALFDCKYMILVLEKSLEILKNNMDLDLKDYIRPRILTDRYIKLKNKGIIPPKP